MITPQTLLNFRAGLEKYINANFSSELKRSAAEEQAVIAKSLGLSSKESNEIPEVNSEVRLVYPKIFSWRVWIKFAVLSWFLKPYSQFELQQVLEKKAAQLRIQNYQSYLYSFDLCCVALLTSPEVSTNDLFGNILQPGTREWILTAEGKKMRVSKPDLIILTLRSQRKPKKKVFRRGYNDHGSLPAADQIARRSANISSDSEQYQIELERNNFELTAQCDLLKTLKIHLELQEGID